MSPEQLMQAKMEIMRPYRRRNMMMGGGLLVATLAICMFGFASEHSFYGAYQLTPVFQLVIQC